MSLVGYDNLKAASKLAKDRELKTLVIDLERVPGHVRAYDAKVNYLPAVMWDEQPRTICWAAKWLGEPRKNAEFASVWEQDDDYLAERSFQLFDEADLVVTYYGKGADIPWLRAEWTKRHMGEPSSWKDIDLYSTVKSRYRLIHKSLNAAAELVGVKTKVDKYDFRVADAAVGGDLKAQRRIQRYNTGDILTTEGVYWGLLPHIKPHPHIAPNKYMGGLCCPRCSSRDLRRTGQYTPGTYIYAEYRCTQCGGPFKAEYLTRGPSVRAL